MQRTAPAVLPCGAAGKTLRNIVACHFAQGLPAMVSRKLRRALVALCLASGLALPATAQAQGASLESQRQAVFAQLLAAPADRALMLRYARLSVQMRDFEAAAATLERFVDLEPGDVGARVELAIAYFALGAYDVARYHLAAAEASGALTAEQAARVARYDDEARGRDSVQSLSGEVAFGVGRTVEAEEEGPFGSLRLDWRIDMGGSNAAEWLTQMRHDTYRLDDFGFQGRTVTRLRTGPEFRLTGDAYGPRLQPYVELMRVRNTDPSISGGSDTVAAGLAYQNPLDARWTAYADLGIGRGDPAESFIDDFDFAQVMAGIGFRPSRDTRIRGTLRWRGEEYGTSDRVTLHSAQIDLLHTFRVDAIALPRRWELRGTARVSDVEDDLSGDYSERLFGAGLRAFVTEDLFVEVQGARLSRDFGPFFDTEETFYGLQIGWEF
jgi:hypothetical protein